VDKQLRRLEAGAHGADVDEAMRSVKLSATADVIVAAAATAITPAAATVTRCLRAFTDRLPLNIYLLCTTSTSSSGNRMCWYSHKWKRNKAGNENKS
jgi:hypothetical protein